MYIMKFPVKLIFAFSIIVNVSSKFDACNPLICPNLCYGGQTCNDLLCKECEFYCGDKTCNFVNNLGCKDWCKINDCKKPACKDCLFCQNKATDRCPFGFFIDVTETVFPKENRYWYQIAHSGQPYEHEGTPVFFDMNGDGELDYFNSMHGHPFQDGEEDRMELAVSEDNQSKESDDDTFRRFQHLSNRIILEDPYTTSMDLHGENVVDLDGDGILDIMISSGGADGNNSTFNLLFWGEETMDELKNETITIFRGGRMAAMDAGVHMEYGLGRINYLLDVNGDGLLDIFCFQDRRRSNIIAPGILLINEGDRTWREDKSMMEFTRTMLLTDADGDGYAQEIVLNRSFCFPQRNGPGVDPNYSSYGGFSKRVKAFCSTRPVGTAVVYKFNSDLNAMEEISKKYFDFKAGRLKQPKCCPHGLFIGDNDCHAKSMASADFDGDLLADHIVLYGRKMLFYFSSERLVGELPIGKKHIGIEVVFPKTCSYAESVRIIDLDNDGKEEILVMCRKAGTFLIYTQKHSFKEWILDNGCNKNGSLGSLNDVTLSGFTEAKLDNICKRDLENWPKLMKICDDYRTKNTVPSPFTSGVCLVDLNNDGFLDVVVSHSFGYLRFSKNVPSENSKSNKFIAFKLKGDGFQINQYGIGSTIILRTERMGEQINQFREISSYQHTGDRYGCKEDRIIFGLGQDQNPVQVIVRWPNGIEQKWSLETWSFSSYLEPMELIYI